MKLSMLAPTDRGALLAGDRGASEGGVSRFGEELGEALAPETAESAHHARGRKKPAHGTATGSAHLAASVVTAGDTPPAHRDRERPRDKGAGEVVPATEHATRGSAAASVAFTPLPTRAAPAPAAGSFPAPPAGPLPPPPAGHEVGGAVLRSAAHLRIDTGGHGALELHLRVQEGSLLLRAGGEAAHLVEARSGELSRALAGEGLRLGAIEVPRSDGAALQAGSEDPREHSREAWRDASGGHEVAARPRGRSSRRADAAAAARSPGHIDVEA